jgi:hypothetical protein
VTRTGARCPTRRFANVVEPALGDAFPVWRESVAPRSPGDDHIRHAVGVISDDDVLEVIREHMAPTTRWRFVIDRDAGLVVRAEHPASAGLGFDLTGTDDDKAMRALAEWAKDREFGLADAAPELEHPEVVLGVRTLALAFGWPAMEVRAVAYLIFESGGLTSMEAGWLAGYAAPDAPMVSQPPAP